jgi:single-stranded-DNA-specific exonuclease
VEFLTSLLDLAALGTFADVVPLSGENRILAVNGLRLINERKRLGIRCLAEAAGIKGDINEERIYYMLAPRINAAGRLEHASKAVELFLSGDLAETQKLAGELSTINTRRQGIGEEIREAVFTRIDDDYLKQNQVIVLHGDNWHPGVIGIVASRVAETYHRPTVLIGINEGVGRGSARSVAGINVYALLDSCRDLFLDFGGHEGAAGMEVALENIPELEKRLKETAERLIAPEDLTPKLLIDAELDLQQLSLGVVKELAKLAPFGEGNPLPLFMSQGLEISQLRVVGKEGKHLKLKLKGEGGVELSAIGFGMGHLQDKLAYGKKYTVAYHLTANEWEGFERVELELVDISATS